MEVLERLRPALAARGSLILPRTCEPKLPRVRWRKLELATRGRYDFAEIGSVAELHRFAEVLTGQPLKPVWTRLYRFRHRGYALFFDDAQSRVATGVELTLDLSRAIAGPSAVYQSGPSERIEVPQLPGVVAIVLRTPGMFRYDRYLPAAVGRATVVRLRAAYAYGR